jgi:FtsH-binding integral membrane protein
MNTEVMQGGISVETAQQRFVTKVMGWMCAALLTTAAVSYYVVSSEQLLMTIITNRMLFFGLIIAELGIVIAISAAIKRLSSMAATGLFFLYAALTGATISVVFIAYTQESIFTTFLITAGTFGAMGIYGYTTKRDLTSVGSLAFMGLIGVILASILNIFVRSTFLYTVVTYVGVLVFVGLTAYDAQKIKRMGAQLAEGSEAEKKGAILGALALYLDFINLFLLLLRIFGRRR